MDYITSWVSEIILLILMAVVLELMLPNSSLQRYVRLVVGLLLLLALLKPILSVFDTGVDDMFDEFPKSSATSNDQIKSSMKSKKSEIQASQRAYIEKQMAVQLKEKAKKEASDRFNMDIATIRVALGDLESDPASSENIKHISIDLTKHQKKGKGDTKPVETVTIDVSKSPEKATENSGKGKKIRDFLAKRWDLPLKKIAVTLEGKDGGSNE